MLRIPPQLKKDHMKNPAITVEPSGPLLVIGAGFGRTGTASLKMALEILYGRPCYHMAEIMINHKDHIEKWTNILDNLRVDPTYEIPMSVIEDIFADYRFTVANPSCVIFEQLMRIYPQAKIVLTIRPSQDWANSIHDTLHPLIQHFVHQTWITKLIEHILFGRGAFNMGLRSFQVALGHSCDLGDARQLAMAYELWNERVQQSVPEERLLVFNLAQGWKPLCEFLQLPVPHVPFPRVNDRLEMKNRVEKVLNLTNAVRTVTLALLGTVASFGIYRLVKCFKT